MATPPTGWTGTPSGSGPDSDWSPDPPTPTTDPELPSILRGEKGDKGDQGEVGAEGPEGPRGVAGGRVVKRAPGVLSAGRAVRALADGDHVDVASAFVSSTARTLVGVVATSAAAADEEVEVVLRGELDDDVWTFTPQQNVYVGDNGVLTQTIDPTWSYVCVVGRALTPTKLLVDVRAPIFLAP